MPERPCFTQVWSELLLKDVTPRRADNRVRKIIHELYRGAPGYVFREVPLTLSRTLRIGIDEEPGRIVMPFKNPATASPSLQLMQGGGDSTNPVRSEAPGFKRAGKKRECIEVNRPMRSHEYYS